MRDESGGQQSIAVLDRRVELLRFNSTKSDYYPVGDCTLIATTAVVSVFTAVVAATDATAAKITSNAATIATTGSDLGL